MQEAISEEQRNAAKELDRMVDMVANEWSGDSRCSELKRFIIELLDIYEKRLHLDKRTIFMALESKRTYSAMNYYQDPRFRYLKEVEQYEKMIKDLYAKLNRQAEAHKEHLREIAKAQADALEVRTKGLDKSSASWDVSLHVECPYCHRTQDVFSDWHQREKWDEVNVCESATFRDFEIECENCGKHYEVEDAKY